MSLVITTDNYFTPDDKGSIVDAYIDRNTRRLVVIMEASIQSFDITKRTARALSKLHDNIPKMLDIYFNFIQKDSKDIGKKMYVPKKISLKNPLKLCGLEKIDNFERVLEHKMDKVRTMRRNQARNDPKLAEHEAEVSEPSAGKKRSWLFIECLSIHNVE